MSRLRRLCFAGGLAFLTLGPTVLARAEPTTLMVPGSSAQHALAVSVGSGQVLAHACLAGKRCSAAGGLTIALPENGIVAKASVESVSLGDDKSIALIRVPLKGGGHWALLIAASDAVDSPEAMKKLSGTIGVPRGKIDGERFTRVLIEEKTASTTRLVIGKRYENATVCGRPATIGTKELDPADMTWRETHARSLSDKVMAGATALTAKLASRSYDVSAPSLLTATVASSAVGRSREGMTDGDLATRWAEKRPGEGMGEFITMNGSEDVAVTGFEIVLRPTGDAPARGAAPKTFFIATDSQVFHITVPKDAWLGEAGQSYEVTLPSPVKSDCFSVVLHEGFTEAERDQIGFAELRARTVLDGKTLTELAELLRGDSGHAKAASALLSRSGKPAITAVIAAYDSLDRRGKGRAEEVLESGNCTDTASFYVDRLLGRGVDLSDFEPDLDPLARRARANLRACRSTAATSLRAALSAKLDSSSSSSGKRRVMAARELADIAPAVALGAILKVLDHGSTAPKESGAKDSVRRGLRRALAIAAKHRRGQRVVREQLATENFAKLSLVQQIDLLRALGSTIVAHRTLTSPAIGRLLSDKATFRTRYLLLPAAGHLARANDKSALNIVRTSLVGHQSRHIRARAAAVAGGIPALAAPLMNALTDKSARVREAALAGMTGGGNLSAEALVRVAQVLAADKWTFVRIGAAQALASQPAGGKADVALVAALDDKSKTVRKAVLRALGERRTTAAGPRIHEIANDAKEAVSIRTVAIAALGALCRKESAGLLFKLALRAGYQQLPYDQPLGLAALAALGELKPPNLAKELAPLLTKNGQVPRVIRSITRDVLSRSGSCK